MAIKVGVLKQNIIDLLALPYKAGIPILLGHSNIEQRFDAEIYVCYNLGTKIRI